MLLPYARHLEGPTTEILRRLRTAALRILASRGCDGPAEPPFIRRARHAGFTVTYYRCEPDALGRRDGRPWSTPGGGDPDGDQHVIDIEVGEHLAGLGWSGNGPIRRDRLIRGPWEFEFLEAAGLPAGWPPGTMTAPAAPEPESRWRSKRLFDPAAFEMELLLPLTFSVVGYSRCMTVVADPGTDFFELRDLVEDCYGASRTADGEVHLDGMPTSSFGLTAWKGRRPVRKGKPIGTSDLRYWIGPRDGASAASMLLLLFDRDMYHARLRPRRRAVRRLSSGRKQPSSASASSAVKRA